MKQRVLHIVSLLLLVAIAFQCLVSCVYEDGFDDRDEDGNVVLVIRTASLDSRSAMSDAVENLHSLRVIILHADGTLEENYFVSNLGGAEQHEHLFKVRSNETKKIYLVANEESMTDANVNLNNLGTNPAETLEGITFTAVPSDPTKNPEFSNGIPMSACYELTVGSEPRMEKDFYLVRAMTKFTFTFQNIRTDNVTLKEMKVSAVAKDTYFADKAYLFPHFIDGNSGEVSSEKFLVDAGGNYAPGAGQFWIDWLKEAVDKSQTGLYTPDEIGWIKDYRLPDDAKRDKSATGIALACGNGHVIKPSDTWEYPGAFYRCESNGGPYEYRISVLRVQADRDESEQKWENSPFLKLNQVKYLFRHTHVEVNVVFGQTNVVIFARIHPWIVIKPTEPLPLEPED